MLPKGFLSAGIVAGLKKSGKRDLGLIHSESPCQCAGVFTQNSVKAHCVIDNQAVLAKGKPIQAVLVNSGNANACNGEAGMQAIHDLKKSLSELLNITTSQILTASTGVIGVDLPTDLIFGKLPALKGNLSPEHDHFAEAILTTDLVIKVSEVESAGSKLIGIAKGSGMIHPDMATMLAFIVTDADLSEINLSESLSQATRNTFNQISVDGDTSTNDMVLLLANGASGIKPAKAEFQDKLEQVCTDLAKAIVRDGEGATKLIEVSVGEASDEDQARKVALGIASSNLVKSAIFGGDPNWGRILAAAGQHGSIDLNKIKLKLEGVLCWSDGALQSYDRGSLSDRMKQGSEVRIDLSLGVGEASAKAWGCDLTYDYVKINAEYFT
ncbi:MAG: bifunctional glutamate N-acetyltransferase/amino-acid acetyltransferase ArgJ [Candidatus Caenarcaniphilales bacterium]|nr:bifunctional glutamate N-acetyltransferase/amino-acid acetyltransferase ArgJ [Candidatus Caenarcaniphilales bacterium]